MGFIYKTKNMNHIDADLILIYLGLIINEVRKFVRKEDIVAA